MKLCVIWTSHTILISVPCIHIVYITRTQILCVLFGFFWLCFFFYYLTVVELTWILLNSFKMNCKHFCQILKKKKKVQVGRDLRRSSWSNLLLKIESALKKDSATQGFHNLAWKMFKYGDCTTTMDTLFQCLTVLIVRRLFLVCFSLYLSCISLHLFSFVHHHATLWRACLYCHSDLLADKLLCCFW